MDANLRAREEGVLAADLGQLSATIASFDAQKAQKSAERDMLEQTIATQKNLIATLQERVDMRAKLVASQSGAKSAVIDATETLQYQQTQLAIHEEELASATTGLDVVARDTDKAVQSFLSDQAQKLDASERQAEENRQHLAKAAGYGRYPHAQGADRRPRPVVDHHQCRPGRRQRQEVMRIVPQRLAAGDRSLCARTRTSASCASARRR